VETDVRSVAGFPDRLEGECRMVDFVSRGSEVRSLFVLFPTCSRSAQPIQGDWQCLPDEGGNLSAVDARRRLETGGRAAGFHLPAYMIADVPVTRRWWYRKSVPVPPGMPAWLRLPRSMMEPCLWIDGTPVDLAAQARLSRLVQPEIALPPGRNAEIDVLLRCDVPVSHFEGGGWGTTGLNGRPALCLPSPEERVLDARWERGHLSVHTTFGEYRVPCALMEDR
jgi:hypothetical protein